MQKKASSFLSFLVGICVFSQTTAPALEIASGAGNPTGTGRVTTTAVNFQNNTNNPTGSTLAALTNPISLTVTLTNEKYTNVGPSNLNSTYIGASQGSSANILTTLSFDNQFNTTASSFSSTTATIGSGIDLTTNKGIQFQTLTRSLYGQSLTGRFQMVDIVFTFSTPVNNPILHFSDLGELFGLHSRSMEFEYVSSNTPVTFSKLSGNTTFSVTNTLISNGSTSINSSNDFASGSVKLNGTGITTVTLRGYMKGFNAPLLGSWADILLSQYSANDFFVISASLEQSDLSVSKVVNNNPIKINDTISFTVTAKNNGPSNNTNVYVTDLLPSGYTFTSASATAGTYNSSTGIWSIGNLNNGSTATLTINAKVNANGSYTNSATITGNNTDPISSNNISYYTGNIDSDGDGVADIDDLDDDNDGILDITEDCTTYLAQNTNGAWKGNTNSTLTVTSTPALSLQTFTGSLSDYQNTYNINQSTAGQRLLGNGQNPEITYTFSTPVKASELAFVIIDADLLTSGDTVSYTFTVNNGMSPFNSFVSVPFNSGTDPYFTYDNITGLINFSTRLDNYRVLLKGYGDQLISSINLKTSGYTALKNDAVAYSLFAKKNCDTDNDGVINQLDLDSDNDGCPDAIEGDENVTTSQLLSNNAINYSTTGGIGTTANVNNGVPNLVNSGGAADIGGDVGQGTGVSQTTPTFSTVTTQPTNKKIVAGTGNTTTFTAAASTGSGTNSYQWQVSKNGGISFTDITNDTVYSGATTTTLTVTAPPMTMSGYEYRLKITQSDFECSAVYSSTGMLSLFTCDGNSNYTLGNNAALDSGNLRITTNEQSKQGHAWSNDSYSLSNNFSHHFKVNLGSNTSGADGMAYVIRSVTTGDRTIFGSNGNGLGYGGISPSLALEFDTYGNTNIGEPSGDHLSLQINGNTSSGGLVPGTGYYVFPTTLKDGLWHDVSVTWNASTKNLRVTFDNVERYNITRDLTSLDFNGNPNVIIGTTASTGAQTNIQRFCPSPVSVAFVACYKPAITTGTTLDANHGITALGRAGATTNWPMARKGAWSVLEAKTKGFVINRLSDDDVAALPNDQLVEGMMVYNTSKDCLQININGTSSGWKCINSQTCP